MQESSIGMEPAGFAIIRAHFSEEELASIAQSLAQINGSAAIRTRGSVYAIRNLLEASLSIQALAKSSALRSLIEPVLGPGAFPVSAFLFDKTPEANWLVPWHQDLTIRVKARRNVEGFRAWSIKGSVVHVQPPAEILESMAVVRIHLDECPSDNGALRVLPGTHRMGRLTDDQIDALRARVNPVCCETKRGGVVLMRPLLLHASSASSRPAHRRVVHIEYASAPLPGGLEWLGGAASM